MLAAVMASVAEEASRNGAGSGAFHGYEFSAIRLGRRARTGRMSRVRVELKQEGELLGSGVLEISSMLPH